jgi:hypothetical protein
LGFKGFNFGARRGERQGVGPGMSADVEKHLVGFEKLATPIDEGGFEETTFRVVVDIHLRENIV